MTRYVLSMILFGGLLGGGLIGGCGEESSPPGGGGKGGVAEGEGEGQGEGEGEGSPNEGEGEGPLPPGGDLEPCGGASKNECRDGYECMTCEEGDVESVPDPQFPGETESCEGKICTCPQWFDGVWWAEFTEVHRTDGQPYDFGAGDPNWPFWSNQEVTFTQDGCRLNGPDQFLLWYKGEAGSIDQPPHGFSYALNWDIGDGMAHPLRSRGTISPDRNTITGTCEGEYPGRPGTTELFPITCAFMLTRR